MTNDEPCDDCGCGLADGNVTTEEVDVEVGLDFSVMIRRFLEQNTKLDEETIIQKVEICPERVTALIEGDGDSGS